MAEAINWSYISNKERNLEDATYIRSQRRRTNEQQLVPIYFFQHLDESNLQLPTY